jgi:hypothetical protein
MIRMKGDHRARTPSCFAVADRLPYLTAIQRASLAVVAGAYVKSVQECAQPRVRSGCTQRRLDFALSITRLREAARAEVRTREARQASRSEVLDHYLGSLGPYRVTEDTFMISRVIGLCDFGVRCWLRAVTLGEM